MFDVSQEFIAQIQASRMASPYIRGKIKTVMCMDTDLKLHVMMATLSKVMVVTSCFNVQVMVDGIQQHQSVLKVRKSW